MHPSPIAKRVFQADFNRALCARFAPADKRRGLVMLVIFDHELAKIRHQTSDPLLRRIKMQFWRDALADENGSGADLARSLIDCFGKSPLMLTKLETIIEAHEKSVELTSSPQVVWDENIQRQQALFAIGCHYLQPVSTTLQKNFLPNCALVYGGIKNLCNGLGSMHEIDKKTADLVEKISSAYEGLAGDLSQLSRQLRPAILPIALVPPYLHLFKASDITANKVIDLHPAKKTWMAWRTMRNGF